MDVTTTNNHYTTKVGTTISHDFKGTYIEMNVFLTVLAERGKF